MAGVASPFQTTARLRASRILPASAVWLAWIVLIALIVGAAPVAAAEETLSELIRKQKNTAVLERIKADPTLLNKQDGDGYSPIILAAAEGNTTLIEQLLALNPALDLQDKEGQTALIRAAKNGGLPVVKLLVAKGARTDIKEISGLTAEAMARQRNHSAVVAYLLSQSGPPPASEKRLTYPDTGETFVEAVEKYHSAVATSLLEGDPGAINMVNDKHQTAIMLAGKLANGDMVDHLVAKGANLHLTDDVGNTALHWAVIGNSTSAISALMAAGADPNTKNKAGKTPLDIAREMNHGNAIRVLEDAAAGKITVVAPPGAGNPLLAAIAGNDLAGVEAALTAAPALATQPDAVGRTPLYIALAAKLEIAACLLEKQADPNRADRDNWRPIHIAAETGRADMVKLLIEHQADPNSTGSATAQTPLYLAAVYGFTDVARVLLAARANPNLNTAAGVTPLHRAAANGYVDIVSLLMLAKADLNAKDAQGRTPLDYAVAAKQNAIIALLQKHGATGTLPVPRELALPGEPGPAPAGGVQPDPNTKLDPQEAADFLAVCEKCDEPGIEAALKRNPNLIYAKNNVGHTPLHLVARYGKPALLKKLLDRGLPVDILHKWKRTPFHIAVEFGNFAGAQFLLEQGASINAITNDKDSALHFAARNDDSESFDQLIRLLLDHKADPTLKNNDGFTPYGAAVEAGRDRAIKIFEAAGIKQ